MFQPEKLVTNDLHKLNAIVKGKYIPNNII